jgi:thiol-disulfide isomerase/thioredoxin
MRCWLCLALAVALLGLVLIGCDSPDGKVRKPVPAPQIIAEDQVGKTFLLSEHKGKVVMLDFWASWCVYCRAMTPEERELVERLKDRPFVLVGVNRDDTRAEFRQALAEDKVTWPNLYDGEGGPIAQAYFVSSLPTIYLIDHKGMLRRYFGGKPSAKELSEAIDKLVVEAEQDAAGS